MLNSAEKSAGDVMVRRILMCIVVECLYCYYMDGSLSSLLMRMLFLVLAERDRYKETLMLATIPRVFVFIHNFGNTDSIRKSSSIINFMRIEESATYLRVFILDVIIFVMQLSFVQAQRFRQHGHSDDLYSFDPFPVMRAISGHQSSHV